MAYPGIPWGNGGEQWVSVSLRVNLTSGTLAAPWSLVIVNPFYSSVEQSYNFQAEALGAGIIAGQASDLLAGQADHDAGLDPSPWPRVAACTPSRGLLAAGVATSELDAGRGEGATLAMIIQVSSLTDLVPHTALLDNKIKCQIRQPVCSLVEAPSSLLGSQNATGRSIQIAG